MKILITVGLIFCLVGAIVFFLRSRNTAPLPSVAPMGHSENQSWVVHRGGQVIEKKAQSGVSTLNDWERLVYCLWVADYMMRNAGDFANAVDMYPEFQTDAKRYAERLELPITRDTFSLSPRKLQQKYFDHFEAICNEIKSAEPNAAPDVNPTAQSGASGVTGPR